MASANNLRGVKIFDIGLIDSKSKSHVAKGPRFHIKMECGQTSQMTEKKHLEGNSVNWSESFRIFDNGADELTVHFHIVKTHSVGIHISSTVGSCEHKIVDLLKLHVDSGYCKLDIANARRYRIILSIEKMSDAMREAIDETSGMLASAPKLLMLEDTWSLFLSHFQTFMTVMDSIAGVNNYVKLAWSIVSAIPTIYLQTRGRSDNIRQLCEKLKDTYEYVTDAKRLQFLKAKQSKVLDVLAKQTSECAFYIQDYIKANIAKKLWKGTSTDDKIKAFNDKFDHLISVMNNSVVLETGIVTLRASETSDELRDLFLLDKMPYASHAGFVPGKKCLPGTRQSMVDAILKWVNSDTPQRILLLTGQTGMGKSAVAHTIAEIFQEQNRLGAMFCFNRSYKDDCGLFFSTISRNLADGDSLWRKSLVEVIRNTDVRMTTDPTRQFNELIIKPAKEATTIGPVVIVIDALNESGGRIERQIILDLLFGRCEEFPDNYRIIVTSCPEQDIELLYKNPAVLSKRMSDIPVNETVSDIQKYLSFKLDPISRILDGIDENWSDVLTKRAERLFQWAETACRFINPTTRHPPLIEKRWKTCISESDSGSALYDLYQRIILTILNQPELEDTQFMHDFKLIVGALMTARRPLSMQALENLFQDVVPHVRTILSPFGSLFLGIDDNIKPIRPLHSSLFDFFQNKGLTNPNSYHIDTSNQSFFALGCLKLLNRMLRFNICDLKTSHIKNRYITDLKSRIDKAIPSHLSYACRFWAFHLEHSSVSDSILDEVRILMHVKLLYLFEALSLLRGVDKGLKSMKILASWCKDMDNELAEKAEDAWRFGYDFGDVMTVSTPHLYLSALPFTPSDSFVFKQFFPLYPHLLRMEVGQSLAPASKIKHLKRHDDAKPFKVTFSSYGPYIATGFDNGELRVWNYETEEMVYSHKPRKRFVLSDVVFSTDRESVYSSSKNGVIRISNFMADSTSHNPYKGDFNGQSRFCTISSNGRFIASNSKSKLRLYDIYAKADMILEAQQTVQNNDSCDPGLAAIGVTVQKNSCSIFSPSGNFLAFIHVDRTENNSAICIWDIYAKECVAAWIQPPKRRIQINALTDTWIAFTTGSSLKICDVPTKTEVYELKIDASVGGVTFFPNNESFLCHVGKTYSIRSILTGELVVENSIEDRIETATISRDSKLIALGTSDGTICIQRWDDRQTEANNSDNTLGRDFSAVVLELWLLNRHLVQVLESGKDRYLQISDITTTHDIVLKRQIGQKSHVSVPLASQDACVGYTLYHQLFLWDKRGEFILEESEYNISALAFSPAGDYLISGNSNGDIKLWNISERHLVHEMRMVSKWIPTLAFSANGSRFLVAYYAAKQTFIEVREFPSRIILKVSFESISPPLKVVFSANETRIACITKSRITILNAFTGELAISLWFRDLAKAKPQFSPDNKYVAWIRYNHASGIHRLELWDINDGIMIPCPWLSDDSDVDTFHFSNDSTSIITSHSPHITKRHINIWEIKTGQEKFRTISHFITWGRPPMMALNGRHLVLAHNAFGTIWNLDMHDVMSGLHKRGSQTALLPIDQPEQETGQECSSALADNEDLEYAKLAWNKALFTEFAEITQGGWILGPNDEYLFWVPPGRRRGLWRPCVTHMAAEHITRLNFDEFVHGTRWTECKGMRVA